MFVVKVGHFYGNLTCNLKVILKYCIEIGNEI